MKMKYYVYDGNNMLRDVRQYEEIFLFENRIIGYEKNGDETCLYTNDDISYVKDVFRLIISNVALNGDY